MTARVSPNRYAPDNTSHPGQTLREMLERDGTKQRQLAKRLGIAPSYLCDFLQCRRACGTRLALRLERVIGVSAEFWLGMQMHHDLATARAIEKRRTKKASGVPTKPRQCHCQHCEYCLERKKARKQ